MLTSGLSELRFLSGSFSHGMLSWVLWRSPFIQVLQSFPTFPNMDNTSSFNLWLYMKICTHNLFYWLLVLQHPSRQPPGQCPFNMTSGVLFLSLSFFLSPSSHYPHPTADITDTHFWPSENIPCLTIGKSTAQVLLKFLKCSYHPGQSSHTLHF